MHRKYIVFFKILTLNLTTIVANNEILATGLSQFLLGFGYAIYAQASSSVYLRVMTRTPDLIIITIILFITVKK